MMRFPGANPFFLSLLFIIISCSGDDEPTDREVEVDENLFINEIYASAGEDWVELFNNSDSEKDISGYKVYDDPANKYTLPAGTTLSSKGFLTLLCNDLATGLNTNFKLSSAGETIFLENTAGKIVDKVAFPILDDGQSYGRFPDGSVNLGTSGSATKGASNGDSKAPVIVTVSRSVIVPALEDDVVITAEILSSLPLAEVQLHVSKNDEASTPIEMISNATNMWQATIPALNATGKIEYYVSASNNGGSTAVSPFEAPAETYFYLLNTDPLPQLKINEFMALNTACCADTDGEEPEFDDWIELYNAGTTAVNIAGMYLSDDIGNPFKSKIPDTNPSLTTIQPGGYLLLWADEEGSQGELHLNFQLSGSGESVGLFYVDGRTIHSYEYGEQQENISTGLSTDGGTAWQSLLNPTPGASNE